MLIIQPQKVTSSEIVLKKSDFEELIKRANQVEKVIITKSDNTYRLEDVEFTLHDIWDNQDDEIIWQKYL
ncbi:MAG: hypothetical protein Q8K98_13130 [Bacteroidota bacterium]|nr:hypothetical protein [Bacteroidota bacterium]